MKSNIAHYRTYDQVEQSLQDHLINTAVITGINAHKLNLKEMGALCGIIHDLGKYSLEFQAYIKSAVGLLTPQDIAYVDSSALKGKIDHSTAGGQYLHAHMPDPSRKIYLDFISLAVASHHSLIDGVAPDGTQTYNNRMNKDTTKTHSDYCATIIDPDVKIIIDRLIDSSVGVDNFMTLLKAISAKYNRSRVLCNASFGLIERFLLSCLVDGDRSDTASFTSTTHTRFHTKPHYSWDTLIQRFDASTLQHFNTSTVKRSNANLNTIRKNISNTCYERSKDPTGLFRLTVPTGGGKTLSSLRFALNHANKHKLDRIIYVIPYTSIIDQNASTVKNLFDDIADDVVLEHHSNIIMDDGMKRWRNKVLAENWDTPIIFTTAVQLSNALFDDNLNNVRRMHTLTNSIIIFDEIQTMPLKMVHIFNNAINFLVDFCNSSVVLCSATQPLLHNVDTTKGCLPYHPKSEIIDFKPLFLTLKRVDVIDKTNKDGWSVEDVVARILKHNIDKSVLYIANTKDMARDTFYVAQPHCDVIYHLSTNMCPKHRKKVLAEVISDIDNGLKVVCISTQLIEAGVDVDFDCVIRSLAGIDSICQAAGRCNRNGNQSQGIVEIINPKPDCEATQWIPDIKKAQTATEQILRYYKHNPNDYDNDIIGSKAIEEFYKIFFFNRSNEMSYNVDVGRRDTLLSLLSVNDVSTVTTGKHGLLNESFASAGKAFNYIESATESVIVPYDTHCKDIISKLEDPSIPITEEIALIKELQVYNVNMFSKTSKILHKANAIHIINEGSDIKYVDEEYYDNSIGLDPLNPAPLQLIIA